MFECEVLTVRDVNFKDQTGKEVVGSKLYVIAECNENGWNGYEIADFWFGDGHVLESFVSSLTHGDKIIIEFNRKGRPSHIQLVE